MTYVTDQTSVELRAHMRRLKAMAGWHEPLADRLFKEVLDLDAEVNALRASPQSPGGGAPGKTDAERAEWLADKIVAGGDYAKEAAQMLRRWPAAPGGGAEAPEHARTIDQRQFLAVAAKHLPGDMDPHSAWLFFEEAARTFLGREVA